MYMARPGSGFCMYCPRGTETLNKGNSACSPCAVGYYNPAPASPLTATDSSALCERVPAGTYTNTTGSFVAIPW